MPYNSCIALSDNLDKARDEIALLKSNASLPCGSCESLLAEINKLKLSYTTCVEVEHARAEINSKIKRPEGTMREGPPFPINSWNKISQIHLKSLTLEKERGEERN